MKLTDRGARRSGRVAWVRRGARSKGSSWVGMALACALGACDGSAGTQAEPGPAPEDDSGPSVCAQVTCDASAGPQPEAAPACDGESVPFLPVLLQATEGYVTAWTGTGSVRVRVVDRGAGAPPGGSSSEFLNRTNEMGWLQLREPLGDAGADGGDAGGAPVGTSATVPHFIVGPRALVDLPVALGEELVLTVTATLNLPLYPGVNRVVLEQGDRVLLFHETGGLGPSEAVAGFARAAGATICEETTPSCLDAYRRSLQVSVPGGATATLAPGQSDIIGGYQVSHGNTVSSVRHQPNTCTDVLFDLTFSQITAVLLPDTQKE